MLVCLLVLLCMSTEGNTVKAFPAGVTGNTPDSESGDFEVRILGGERNSGSSNGRTTDFESVNDSSTLSPEATV